LPLDPQTKPEIDELITFVQTSGVRSCSYRFRPVEAQSAVSEVPCASRSEEMAGSFASGNYVIDPDPTSKHWNST
jgi:hypothetical protein